MEDRVAMTASEVQHAESEVAHATPCGISPVTTSW